MEAKYWGVVAGVETKGGRMIWIGRRLGFYCTSKAVREGFNFNSKSFHFPIRPRLIRPVPTRVYPSLDCPTKVR